MTQVFPLSPGVKMTQTSIKLFFERKLKEANDADIAIPIHSPSASVNKNATTSVNDPDDKENKDDDVIVIKDCENRDKKPSGGRRSAPGNVLRSIVGKKRKSETMEEVTHCQNYETYTTLVRSQFALNSSLISCSSFQKRDPSPDPACDDEEEDEDELIMRLEKEKEERRNRRKRAKIEAAEAPEAAKVKRLLEELEEEERRDSGSLCAPPKLITPAAGEAVESSIHSESDTREESKDAAGEAPESTNLKHKSSTEKDSRSEENTEEEDFEVEGIVDYSWCRETVSYDLRGGLLPTGISTIFSSSTEVFTS